MKGTDNNEWLDDALAEAIGSEKSEPDFEKWQREHPEAAETLTTRAGQPRPGATRLHNIRTIAMKSKIVKLAAAAVIILALALLVSILNDSATPAYGIEQTIEAFKNVRYMHIVRGPRKDKDQGDERWIEIMADGSQGRYRQDTPPLLFVVDDRKTVFAYRENKNTVVLYDPNQQTWTWHSKPGRLLEGLADSNAAPIIEEYVDYKGRPAHLVRCPTVGLKCYVDPASKLPIAFGEYEISYEQPPEGTFDIPPIPEGVIFVDKRPGAEPTQEPEWMKAEAEARLSFRRALYLLAEGKRERAIEILTGVVEVQPGRNWAWYWLGKAHYGLGKYEEAIEHYSVVCPGGVLSCYNLARGRAYKQLGMEDAAMRDFGIAMEAMIDSLRHVESMKGALFDYAEDPLYRYDSQRRPSPQQRFENMINRLREVTGQDFGYEPSVNTPEEIEQVISAWEDWWSEHAVDYGVDLD